MISLIRPPVLQQEAGLSYYGAILPIGLAYVAATLRKAGHEPRLIDGPGEDLDRWTRFEGPTGWLQLQGLSPEEIVDRLDPASDVVAITHMFLHEWPTIRHIARLVKERCPGAHVVLGGENATAHWETILTESADVDACVLGEGEATLVEVVRRIEAGESLVGVAGVACRDGDRPVSGGLSPRLRTLDELPWPAWDLFPVERYMAQSNNFGVHRGRTIPMLATRGCPYQCTFCSSPQMWTTRYDLRSPAEVVREMRYYVETYGIDNVDFCDLTAIVVKDWVIEFTDLLREAKLPLTWQLPTGTRTEALDDEVLRGLYATGCRNLTYAPESGSRRMLKTLKKKVQIPRLLASMRGAHRAGLVVRINVIIGHPEDHRRDHWESFKLLLRAAWIGCSDAAVMIFAPYPGSEDFETLRARGAVEIDEGYHYLALMRSGASTRGFNPRIGVGELRLVQFGMLSSFYVAAYGLRPWRVLSLLSSMRTGVERTQMDQFLRVKRRQSHEAGGHQALEPGRP